MLQSLFYLTTALHVSGVIITHLQEHKRTVTTAIFNVAPCMLPHLFYNPTHALFTL
jgi:hypothetical protein